MVLFIAGSSVFDMGRHSPLMKGTAEMVSPEKHPDYGPATLFLIQLYERIMNSTIPSTRVQAPAQTDPNPLHVSSETNDGPSPNPTGQDVPDRSVFGSSQKLLKCKKPTVYSTFNVRTLNPTSRLHELTTTARNCCVNIISIQEHRHFHPDTDLEYTHQDG